MNLFLFFAIGGAELLFLLLFMMLPCIVWIWALVEVVRSDFRRDSDKILWIIIIVFGSLLGVIIYFLFGRNRRISTYR
jgi:hypothetical protein